MRVKSSQTPVRHRAPYATTSTNGADPDRFGYLRGMLCALRHSPVPLGGLVPDPQPKCNLEVRDSIKMQSRLHLDCGSVTRPPSGTGEWRSAQSMPRRYPKRSGSAPFVDVVAYGALWRTGVWELFTRIRGLLRQKRCILVACATERHTRPHQRIRPSPAVPDISGACSARSASRLHL